MDVLTTITVSASMLGRLLSVPTYEYARYHITEESVVTVTGRIPLHDRTATVDGTHRCGITPCQIPREHNGVLVTYPVELIYFLLLANHCQARRRDATLLAVRM